MAHETNNETHGTAQEIDFINKIGRFTERMKNDDEVRELRAKYFKALNSRANWGGIDEMKIKMHLIGLLK